MDDLKTMPEGEKFGHAFEMVDLYQKHVLPFVEQRLGFAERHNLQSIWQAAIAPLHEGDSDQVKYAQAYSNWLWIAHCSHNALADQLSTHEVLEYKRLLLRLYSKRLDRPELAVLRLLKRYASLAKALLYEMQWMTHVEVITCSRRQVICLVHNCKVRQTPGTERICRVDCRNVGSAYASQLYNIKRETVLSDHGCQITLTPFNHKKD